MTTSHTENTGAPDEAPLVREQLRAIARERQEGHDALARAAEDLPVIAREARAAGLTVTEIARLAGVSRVHVHRVLRG